MAYFDMNDLRFYSLLGLALPGENTGKSEGFSQQKINAVTQTRIETQAIPFFHLEYLISATVTGLALLRQNKNDSLAPIDRTANTLTARQGYLGS